MTPSTGLADVGSDPEAFEHFYRDQLPLVRAYLARRLDDPAVVADLTTDVFLRVVDSASGYRPVLGPPRAWLIGIARNVVADHHRSRHRELAAVQRWGGRRLLDEDSAQRIVERITAERGARELLERVSRLPAASRDVIELVAVDGLSTVEAADVLRISPGAVRVRYHRARRSLRATQRPTDPASPTSSEVTT